MVIIGKSVFQEKNSRFLVVKTLDSLSRVPSSNPLDGFKLDSAFHPSEVNKLSSRNFLERNGKK